MDPNPISNAIYFILIDESKYMTLNYILFSFSDLDLINRILGSGVI